MAWADNYIKDLQAGHTIMFRPRGNSMSGKIESGNWVTVVPRTVDPICGDIVLCRVSGNQYLHLVSAVQGDRFQISNNRGRVNGWTHRDKIYGIVCDIRTE